jgi:uncharacterized protein
MVQYIRLVCLVLMLLAGIGSVAKAASFDCNKATTETEIAICADPELSALDELMGEIWGQTSQSSRAVNDQVRWLTERDALSNIWHLIEFYNYRIV